VQTADNEVYEGKKKIKEALPLGAGEKGGQTGQRKAIPYYI
jgi:hypothetical protein